MYYTWISKKQIGVIFSNWKRGNLNLTEEMIKWLYNTCAEVKGFKNNFRFDDVLSRVRSSIDMIFSGEYADAEDTLNTAYNLYNAIYA